jgi:hypothetical protein
MRASKNAIGTPMMIGMAAAQRVHAVDFRIEKQRRLRTSSDECLIHRGILTKVEGSLERQPAMLTTIQI